MKFIMAFNLPIDAQLRSDVMERFQNDKLYPTQGVTVVGRWTKADLSGGYNLLETDDPKKLTEFSYKWSDILDLSISPVLDDEELDEALQNAKKMI